ncbi:hypothetical protein [Pseudoclavibacter sp. 13-3]|nr:hypothetical protein [Pseudoclavibacter sp. 13-3]
MIEAVAGLALIGAFGVGVAFWALVAGLVVHALLERRGGTNRR